MAADAEQGLKANQRALATNQFALVLKAKALGTFKTQLAPGAILSNGMQSGTCRQLVHFLDF